MAYWGFKKSFGLAAVTLAAAVLAGCDRSSSDKTSGSSSASSTSAGPHVVYHRDEWWPYYGTYRPEETSSGATADAAVTPTGLSEFDALNLAKRLWLQDKPQEALAALQKNGIGSPEGLALRHALEGAIERRLDRFEDALKVLTVADAGPDTAR